MANEINRLVIGFCNLTPPVSKNNPPVANAGKDIVISLPENAVQLNGQVSDPDEESLIIQWSKLTGPANDIVISPNSAVASVQNLRQGVYQYVLSVRDKAGAFDADTVRVIVNQPKPKPPVADAGMNIVISLPQSTVTLDGSGSQPNDNTLSYFWEKLGDISPNIQLLNHRTVKPGITGLTAGKYEFTLTVQNKMEQVDRDTVMIIVNQPPRKPNNKPSASAGKDQKITLPDNSITLNGSARDPDNDPLVIEWKQVSGPVQAEMNSRDSFTPKVIFFQEGVYEFMLTVADPYGASATDRVIITVKQRALVFINNPPVADAGPDQQLVLGKDKLVLTGKGYDQDPQGYIVSYRWDKLDRVDSVRILSRFDSITAVDRIDTGLHQFQLTVRDNFGKSATDTVMIRIVAPSPGGSAWVWIMLGTGLLAIASTLYILWWRRQPEKIIVYFINKAEEELAHAMVPDAKSTDGYVVGHSTRSNIREMKKKACRCCY